MEDLPSGLTLQFEAFEGGVRLTLAGKALPANREIVFDAEGASSRAQDACGASPGGIEKFASVADCATRLEWAHGRAP